MLKLYGGARSRASIIQWYLEELAVPYEYIQLDMEAGEHRQQIFLGINPMGKVPAIVDGELKLWESGAILLYLADKYGGVSSSEERAQGAQWSLFANATLGPGVFVEASREREMPRLMAPLDEIFSKQPFLLGDSFSVADVAVGSYLNYIPILLKLDLSDYPHVMKYMQRIAERPAFQKTIGARA
ncbi:glutathione S-transferase family protein [Calothrix rhizosoleniae]|uniref:glutathione S-transferase family protein n=1 Tax=Calothrix rhizosoleniae TaxID=888997 RepID=UPI000B49B8E1|nr:glutathione S-transferase family protein [Calothrix rhizosoleniae]